MGSVVVSNWGYGTAFIIAGTVGIVCAFITLLLRQPKLSPSEQAEQLASTKEKQGHQEQEAASLALD
jgi:hypothetical protein